MKTALIVVGLVIFGVALAPVVIGLAWTWVVGDVFAGAVEQGILPSTLTWLQGFKLMILLAALGLTSRGSSKS